ncbi:hypothetical protein ACMHYB_22895 [Sorangium sp. So ce1128]
MKTSTRRPQDFPSRASTTGAMFERAVFALLLASAGCAVEATPEENTRVDIVDADSSEQAMSQGTKRGDGDVGSSRTGDLPACTPVCDGACSPVLLAAGQANPHDLSLTPDKVVWAVGHGTEVGDNGVSMISKAGGTVTSVVQSASSFIDLGVAGSEAYFTGGTRGYIPSRGGRYSLSGVWKVDEAGQPSQFLGPGSGYLVDVAADATNLYLATRSSIRTLPLSGGSPVDLVTFSSGTNLWFMRMDDTSLYATNYQGRVWKAPKTGGTPAELSTGLGGSPSGMAVDADSVYVSIRSVGIVRLPKAGGVATTVATGAASYLAADAERLYWFDGSSLVATCKNGGGRQVVATGMSDPRGIAVDDSQLYWGDSNKVWRVTK